LEKADVGTDLNGLVIRKGGIKKAFFKKSRHDRSEQPRRRKPMKIRNTHSPPQSLTSRCGQAKKVAENNPKVEAVK
jgi:hypothetical protein